ncbi:MAG: flavodoxin family protein [Candidatus Geothermarchaeales archaeon]
MGKEEKIRVLGIVCSPRRGGNTEILVNEALLGSSQMGGETELLLISEYAIEPCDSCRTCRATGRCHIEDDMQAIYPKLLEADGIIIGSPVHFWSVSGQAKVLIDRTYSLLYPKLQMRNKVGGAIAVATTSGCRNALDVLNTYFLYQNMYVVGHGVAAHGGEKGAVREDVEAMKESRELGKRVVRLASQRFRMPKEFEVTISRAVKK